MTALVVVAGLAAVAVAALRWLRVAQREHYIAGSCIAVALRWLRVRPASLGGLLVALVAWAVAVAARHYGVKAPSYLRPRRHTGAIPVLTRVTELRHLGNGRQGGAAATRCRRHPPRHPVAAAFGLPGSRGDWDDRRPALHSWDEAAFSR